MFKNLNIGLKEYQLLEVSHDKEPIIDVELKKEYEPKNCVKCSYHRLQGTSKNLN